jgi:hypothetical protein
MAKELTRLHELAYRLFGAFDEKAADDWRARDKGIGVNAVMDPRQTDAFCGMYTMEEDGREDVVIFLPEGFILPDRTLIHELGHWFHCTQFRDLTRTVARVPKLQPRAEAVAVFTELLALCQLVWDDNTVRQWSGVLLYQMEPDVLRIARRAVDLYAYGQPTSPPGSLLTYSYRDIVECILRGDPRIER